MTSRLLVLVLATCCVGIPGARGQEEQKEKKQGAAAKTKDQPPGKAKPPARTFTDEDLKKYKDKPAEDSPAATPPPDASPSSSETNAAPRQRRSREYGGYQELPPSPPSSDGAAADQPAGAAAAESSAAAETQSPEEVEWRQRAAEARRPLDDAQARIHEIESEMAGVKDQLNPMSTNYVLGGNSTAGPSAVLEAEEKLRNLESRLIDAKTELSEAQKGWDAFLEEARKAGASAAWLKP
jgi:hypothetical protein